MIDIAIAGNHICMTDGIRKGVVLIRNGVIADILDDYPQGTSYDAIYIGDKVLMPGIVDPHVHINEPGRAHWEGFVTATMAAVAGGVTTLVDMPLNSSPVTTTVEAFEQKLAAAQMLQADCGFWGGLVPGNTSQIEPLIDKGVLGFKAFLTHSGIDEFPAVTEEDLRKAMPVIAKHGLPLLVHGELSADATTIANTRSYNSYLQSRPASWEDDAVALMIRLCEEYQCRVHIVHLSSAGAIPLIQEAKQKGLPLTVETAQHYLYFNAEDIPDTQPAFKCAPPIRGKENNALLWQALQDGIIDFVATDHSPSPPEIKEPEAGDWQKAWGGISSLQFSLPALWTAARRRKLHWSRLAKWLCEKPAALCGLQRKKGRIAKGYQADLVVWDPHRSFKVVPDGILHKHRITPYMNEELYGVVEQTWLRGEQLYYHGDYLELNKGKIITR